MKIFVLLMMSLLMVNCGVEEPTVGESKSAGYESETTSTLKKVGKYAVYTVAGVGVAICITGTGLKKACTKVVGEALTGSKSTKPKTIKELVDEAATKGDSLTRDHKRAKKIMDKAADDEKVDVGKQVIEVADGGKRDYSETIWVKGINKVKGIFKKSGEAKVKGDGGEAAETAADGAEAGATK